MVPARTVALARPVSTAVAPPDAVNAPPGVPVTDAAVMLAPSMVARDAARRRERAVAPAAMRAAVTRAPPTRRLGAALGDEPARRLVQPRALGRDRRPAPAAPYSRTATRAAGVPAGASGGGPRKTADESPSVAGEAGRGGRAGVAREIRRVDVERRAAAVGRAQAGAPRLGVGQVLDRDAGRQARRRRPDAPGEPARGERASARAGRAGTGGASRGSGAGRPR